MATIQQALERFGVVTVMDAYFFPEGTTNFNVISGVPTGELFKLDTLRISNFTQEGPRKTAKGGLNAETIFRYGKTARLEMEDVVGRIAALEKLMGVRAVTAGTQADTPVLDTFVPISGATELVLSQTPEVDPTLVLRRNGVLMVVGAGAGEYSITGRIITLVTPANGTDTYTAEYEYLAPLVDGYKITEEFENKYTIFGRTFVIDQATGDREYINIIIHKFLPDSLFNMNMEAEGDFAVISMAGELFTNDCGVFYEFTKGTQPAGC